MTCRNDRNYYATRAREETSIAESSANRKVAAIHFEMALRYALLAYGPSVQVMVENRIFGGRRTERMPRETKVSEGERAYY